MVEPSVLTPLNQASPVPFKGNHMKNAKFIREKYLFSKYIFEHNCIEILLQNKTRNFYVKLKKTFVTFSHKIVNFAEIQYA